MGSGLGLRCLDHVEFAVPSIEGFRRYFEHQLALIPVAISTDNAVSMSGQRSRVYAVGRDHIILTEPVSSDSRAGRFLQIHPAGVMTIGVAVADVPTCFEELVRRNATPITDVMGRSGEARFLIASPVGDIEFCFIQHNSRRLSDQFDVVNRSESAPRFPWLRIDHITANVRTAWPVAEWYRQVLGLEDLFLGEMHTGEAGTDGTGFKWKILWDPESQLKLATNEPLRPHFADSQTEKFVVENRGAGIQHLALAVPRITDAVLQLRANGVPFLSTPSSYYDPEALRARAGSAGWDLDAVAEPLALLRELNILIDGSDDGYMLQIFQEDFSQVIRGVDASPFFFEIIQRAGDEGFGYGTFRALFESLENNLDLRSRSTLEKVGGH